MKRFLVIGIFGVAFSLLAVIAVQFRHREKLTAGASASEGEESPGESPGPSPLQPRLRPTSDRQLIQRQEKSGEQPRENRNVRPEVSHERIVADLENAFRSDGPPNGISAKLEAAIVAALGQPAAQGSYLNNVYCRATRCKLDIDFSDNAASNRVLSEFMDMLGTAGTENVGNLGFLVASRDLLPDGTTVRTAVHLFPVSRTPKESAP